jgi:protein-disulfide isomerase
MTLWPAARRVLQSVATSALLTFGLSVTPSAQQPARPAPATVDPDLAKRLSALEEGQRELLRQVQAIKTLLEAATGKPAPPTNLELSIENAASRGRADAPLTIVEFSDFQCPFCGRFNSETLPQLLREYVDTGKVRLVFRHFPIASLHADALKASEAGECARLQGKFWQMHDQMFANQQKLTMPALQQHASAVGLEPAAFLGCMNGAASKTIQQDLDTGTRANVTGTPTFFLGVMQNGQVHVLRMLVGAAPFASFRSELDEMLTQIKG